jgi:hypothetical protein
MTVAMPSQERPMAATAVFAMSVAAMGRSYRARRRSISATSFASSGFVREP